MKFPDKHDHTRNGNMSPRCEFSGPSASSTISPPPASASSSVSTSEACARLLDVKARLQAISIAQTNVHDGQLSRRRQPISAPTLDASAFPHLVDRIAHFSPPPTILAIASTSLSFRARLLPRLYAHVSLLTSRDDTITLRSTAGTAIAGHKHRPAADWDAPTEAPPPLPGPARVLDLHPGRSITTLPPGVLSLVSPSIVRLQCGELSPGQRPFGHFMRLHFPSDITRSDVAPLDASRSETSSEPGTEIKLVVLVQRDIWLDPIQWRFDARVRTLVVHFSKTWCTGYRQNPCFAVPHLPVWKGRVGGGEVTMAKGAARSYKDDATPTQVPQTEAIVDRRHRGPPSPSTLTVDLRHSTQSRPLHLPPSHTHSSSDLPSFPLPTPSFSSTSETPSSASETQAADADAREVVLIFRYLDGVQLPPLVHALAGIVAEACRPHSGETRLTIVGDTDDAGWLARVVRDMRARLDYYEDDRVEFDGTCPVSLVGLDEYAARVGGEGWALETDAGYRFVGG